MEGYVTVKERARYEYEDRKSIFIGDIMPVSTETEALGFIESVKKTFPDARHHVYAYVLRENSIMRFTDDREPQGTAGMPVLDSIRKNGLTDTVIVVTRYFGGTLLGTGGLVRAYGTTALGAIEKAGIARFDLYNKISVSVSYSDYQKIQPIIAECGFRIDEVIYRESVEIRGSILSIDKEYFADKLVQATSARVEIKIFDAVFDC